LFLYGRDSIILIKINLLHKNLLSKGFIDIDLLSNYLESFNNYKHKPINEALFITMIKFFKDNYIKNEENLQSN
jgi:hypothetical protein